MYTHLEYTKKRGPVLSMCIASSIAVRVRKRQLQVNAEKMFDAFTLLVKSSFIQCLLLKILLVIQKISNEKIIQKM